MEETPRLVLAFIETKQASDLKRFYGDLLGLAVRKEFGDSWTEFASGDMRLAVHRVEAKESDLGAARLYLSFEVSDLDGLQRRLIRSGVDTSEIRTRDRGRFFVCEDPAGIRLHFISFDPNWKSAEDY